jgi:hypothetical protein
VKNFALEVLFLTLSVVDLLDLFVVACHDVFLAAQSTSRAEIADSTRNPPNHHCRRHDWAQDPDVTIAQRHSSRLLRQIAAKKLRQIAPKATRQDSAAFPGYGRIKGAVVGQPSTA